MARCALNAYNAPQFCSQGPEVRTGARIAVVAGRYLQARELFKELVPTPHWRPH